MKQKSLLLALILSLAMLLSACGVGMSNDSSVSMDSNKGYAEDYEAPESGYGGVTGGSYDSDGLYGDENVKLIRTAELTVQTTDFDASVDALNQLTRANGGYYETARVEGGSYYNQSANRSAYYVVRVPAEHFVDFRDGTGGIGYVYNLTQNQQDVGETYYDTEARLATLTTKRERLLALLEQAEKMEDIIALESELADLQYEIDQHTATLRKYDSLVNYSTFTIWMYEVTEVTNEPSVKDSFGTRLLASLKAGFEDFGDALEDLALWFARNLISLVFLAAVVVAVVIAAKRMSRGRKDRKSKKTKPTKPDDTEQ